MMTLMNMFSMVSTWLILCGLMSFISNSKHLLNTLLSLELIMLGIFWTSTITLTKLYPGLFASLFLLTLIACEGALGLALLILVVRNHGSDYTATFNSLQC